MVDPVKLELSHLASFVGLAANVAVLKALKAKGFEGVRTSHGFVVQRLLEGPQAVTALARQLQVSQQGASKLVKEMRALGLVKDGASDDARVRKVQLTAKGQRCVEVSRAARKQFDGLLIKRLGTHRYAQARTALAEALDAVGGLDSVRQRRIKPAD